MVEAIRNASVGDDVYEEDEATNSFQERIKELTGKPGALFFPSGTMSNQVAVRSNLFQPPYSILADDRAHVYRNEAAGLAILSQAMVYPAFPSNGLYLTLEDIKKRVIDFKDIHVATTKLICLENTLNGIVMPIEEIKRISEFAKANDIRMHLDGARLWNASAETGISLKEYCQYFDTVSLCLSKGMGAPIGSVVVADATTIETVRWIRKQQGGGMRQVGLLAAAANVAIDEVWPTMKTTHEVVKKVAKYLEEDLGYKFEGPVQTNFIFIDGPRSGVDIVILEDEAKKRGLNVVSNRLAFHYQVSAEAIEKLKEAAKVAIERSRELGIKPTGGETNGIAVAGSKSGSHKYAPVKN